MVRPIGDFDVVYEDGKPNYRVPSIAQYVAAASY